MNRVSITVLGVLLSCSLFAQTDSVMLKRLNKAIFSCEIISTNSQRLMVRYSSNEMDSITRVVSAWEHVCLKNEPISRVKVLMAIQSGMANDTLLADYLFHYRYRYTNRIERSHWDANFEYLKEYLDYVPLKGDFDKWTARWAAELMTAQQSNSSAYLICLFLSNHIKEFNDTFSSRLYKKHPLVVVVKEMMIAETPVYRPFGFKMGVWVPTGKLAQYSPSPLIGFELGGEIADNSRFDLVFDLAFLSKNSPITLKVGSSNPVQTSAKAVLNLGVLYTRQFELNKSFSMDALGGLGYSRVDTDLKKPSKPDEEDSYYGAGAMDFSWGTMLYTRFGNRSQLGLRCMYHYAPYKTFTRILAKDIGNQYYTVALMYRF